MGTGDGLRIFCGAEATTNLGLAGHLLYSYQQISTYKTMLNSGTKQHSFIKVLPYYSCVNGNLDDSEAGYGKTVSWDRSS